MKLLLGKVLDERSYETKKGFKVREVLVQEFGVFQPSVVQLAPDYVLKPDKNGFVEIPIVCSAYDSRSGKYTTSAVKFKAVSSREELSEEKA